MILALVLATKASCLGTQETGDTDVRSLMVGLDTVDETAILYELQPGAVVTAFRASGFGVETVQCKDLGFTVWGVGGQVEVYPLWRHFHQGLSGPIYVVNSNDRNKVVDAGEELNKLVKDAIGYGCARSREHTHALKLSAVRMNEDVWWGMLMEKAVVLLSPRAKSRPDRLVLDFWSS